jgi:hypothetical protein
MADGVVGDLFGILATNLVKWIFKSGMFLERSLIALKDFTYKVLIIS